MAVVSASNFIYSEAEKATTPYNFQTIDISSFVMPHDLMKGQIRSYGYMQINLFVVPWWQNCQKRP